jgi:hypothetical protein
MAIGPFARILAQIVVPVVAVLARALPAAYAQALQNARKSGVDAAEASAPVFGKRISRSEALQVLNLTEEEVAANPEAVQRVSDRSRNGSRHESMTICVFFFRKFVTNEDVIDQPVSCLLAVRFLCVSNSKDISQRTMLVREGAFICNPRYIGHTNC